MQESTQQIQILNEKYFEVEATKVAKRFEKITKANNSCLILSNEMRYAAEIVKNSELLQNIIRSDPNTVGNCFLAIADMGLSLNPSLKHVYLVPRKVNRKLKCCVDISYFGFIKIAAECCGLSKLYAEIVREGDEFVLQGREQAPIHNFNPFDPDRINKKTIGAYAVAIYQDGTHLVEIMSWEEIYVIRSRSSSYTGTYPNLSPWVKDTSEMIKKSVIRKMAKYWSSLSAQSRVQAVFANEDHENAQEVKNNAQKTDEFLIEMEESE